jgi:hypothetical protein
MDSVLCSFSPTAIKASRNSLVELCKMGIIGDKVADVTSRLTVLSIGSWEGFGWMHEKVGVPAIEPTINLLRISI